jgi:cell wall-associated NlpC family hydrolase
MRQTAVVLSTVLTAVTLASVLLFVVPATSLAAVPPSAGGPSQGTYTEGTAGPNEPSLVSDTPPSTSDSVYTASTSDSVYTATSTGTERWLVAEKARSYIGTRYRYATCTQTEMSCTCLTKRTWAGFGHTLPMTTGGQWNYEPSRWIAKTDLRRGDIVFFKEAGWSYPITHVGIYSGKGNLVHASNYFDKVVESKMVYIAGYYGAKRLQPR